MKQFLISVWLSLFSVLGAWAADPIFINDSAINSPPDTAPVIDAVAWINRAVFNLITVSSGIPLAYESQHTLFFTNTAGGVMNGDPGFRFWQNSGSQQHLLWMDTWTNSGHISSDHFNTFGSV